MKRQFLTFLNVEDKVATALDKTLYKALGSVFLPNIMIISSGSSTYDIDKGKYLHSVWLASGEWPRFSGSSLQLNDIFVIPDEYNRSERLIKFYYSEDLFTNGLPEFIIEPQIYGKIWNYSELSGLEFTNLSYLNSLQFPLLFPIERLQDYSKLYKFVLRGSVLTSLSDFYKTFIQYSKTTFNENKAIVNALFKKGSGYVSDICEYPFIYKRGLVWVSAEVLFKGGQEALEHRIRKYYTYCQGDAPELTKMFVWDGFTEINEFANLSGQQPPKWSEIEHSCWSYPSSLTTMTWMMKQWTAFRTWSGVYFQGVPETPWWYYNKNKMFYKSMDFHPNQNLPAYGLIFMELNKTEFPQTWFPPGEIQDAIIEYEDETGQFISFWIWHYSPYVSGTITEWRFQISGETFWRSYSGNWEVSEIGKTYYLPELFFSGSSGTPWIRTYPIINGSLEPISYGEFYPTRKIETNYWFRDDFNWRYPP